MTKYKGRSTRPIPNLGIVPDPDPEYSPPPIPPAEEMEFRIDLDDLFLVVRQVLYRGLVVDFALMLYCVEADEEDPKQICRVDCCHGTVHRHDFRKDKSQERDDPTVLWKIDARQEMNPWNQVDEQFQPQYDTILSEYDELRRRWAA